MVRFWPITDASIRRRSSLYEIDTDTVRSHDATPFPERQHSRPKGEQHLFGHVERNLAKRPRGGQSDKLHSDWVYGLVHATGHACAGPSLTLLAMIHREAILFTVL